jgi:hypothetical protein
MYLKHILLAITAFFLLSFSKDTGTVEFKYPKSKEAVFTISADKLGKFQKEWRGEDYYYICEKAESGIICSVLFYKLNKDEEKAMVSMTGPMAGIPFIYFSDNSNLKPYEKNNQSWGKVSDDFMFRQNDILEFEGIKVKQKHMYAYGMFGTDLFVNVHLSKANYSTSDSAAMREILASVVKKK